MNILKVTLDDMQDNEIQRKMHVRASRYKKSLLEHLERLSALGGELPDKHVYKSAVSLYYLLVPATDAAITVYWQHRYDPENEKKKQAAELVLATWREYHFRAKELLAELRQMSNEEI